MNDNSTSYPRRMTSAEIADALTPRQECEPYDNDLADQVTEVKILDDAGFIRPKAELGLWACCQAGRLVSQLRAARKRRERAQEEMLEAGREAARLKAELLDEIW